jgi:hypothetical protein
MQSDSPVRQIDPLGSTYSRDPSGSTILHWEDRDTTTHLHDPMELHQDPFPEPHAHFVYLTGEQVSYCSADLVSLVCVIAGEWEATDDACLGHFMDTPWKILHRSDARDRT